jgi:hypothetical protein
MRGGFKHNCILIAPIEQEARALGANVYREYRVKTPAVEGFVDLLVITKLQRRIAYEAENTLDRVRWDIAKGRALQVDQLQIIFPNGRLARAAQKRVDEMKGSRKAVNLSILCLTVGAAVQQLKDKKGFDVDLEVGPTSIHQSPTHKPQSTSVTGRD